MTSGFDLDLNAVEQELERDDAEADGDRRIVLGVLDGTTDDDEWFRAVERGDVLVLAIEGELSELAADLAEKVKGRGGNLVHFREFLLVTPADVTIDSERL